MELKKSIAAWVPVRILDAGGDGVAGVAWDDVSATAVKAGGGTTDISPAGAGDWAEIVTGAFGGSGVYQLYISATATNTIGMLNYAVTDGVNKIFVGYIQVVDNFESDTYASVDTLLDVALGEYKVESAGPDANRIILYTRVGGILKKFDLKNIAGDPAVVEVFRRIPVP